MAIEKVVFKLDGLGGEYQGFFKGQRWNGWAVPFFTKEVADQILDDLIENGVGSVWYTEADDTFYYHIYDGEIEEFEDVEWTEGHNLEIDGQLVRVYSIGGHSWIWDEYYPKTCKDCGKRFLSPYKDENDYCGGSYCDNSIERV